MPTLKTPGKGSDTAAAPKPKMDVYVGLLGLALFGQILAALFFWLDLSAYPANKPPPVAKATSPRPAEPAPAGGGIVAPQPPAPGTPAPGAPQTPAAPEPGAPKAK